MGYIAPLNIQSKTGEDLLIRTAERKDGREMQLLTKDVILEESGLIMSMEDFFISEEEQMKRNDLFLQHPQTIAIIAEHKKQVIAILTIEPEYLLKTAHRGNVGIIIHRSFRSQGIGKILMEIAIKWAKENRYYKKLELEVLQSNSPGIALYEKVGFTHEGIIKKAVKYSDKQYEDLVKMGLLLS